MNYNEHVICSILSRVDKLLTSDDSSSIMIDDSSSIMIDDSSSIMIDDSFLKYFTVLVLI